MSLILSRLRPHKIPMKVYWLEWEEKCQVISLFLVAPTYSIIYFLNSKLTYSAYNYMKTACDEMEVTIQ